MTQMAQNLNLQWLDAFKNSADMQNFGAEGWIDNQKLRDIIIPKLQEKTVGIHVRFDATLENTGGAPASYEVGSTPMDMAFDDISIKDNNDSIIADIQSPDVMKQLSNLFLDESVNETDLSVDIGAGVTQDIFSEFFIPVSHINEIHKVIIDCGLYTNIMTNGDVNLISAVFSFDVLTSQVGVDSFEINSFVKPLVAGNNFINELPNGLVLNAILLSNMANDTLIDDITLYDNQHGKFAINSKYSSLISKENFIADYNRPAGSLILQFNEFVYDNNNGSTFKLDATGSTNPVITTIHRIGTKTENTSGTRPGIPGGGPQPGREIIQPGEQAIPPRGAIVTPPTQTIPTNRLAVQPSVTPGVSTGLLGRFRRR